MKISNFMPQIKADNKLQKVKESQDLAPASSRSSIGSDRVDLSVGSLDVSKMKEIIQETPEVRGDIVQELRARIESGDYKVDSRGIADKMLKGLLEESGPY